MSDSVASFVPWLAIRMGESIDPFAIPILRN
jgi:hypothetical protein